MPLVVSYFNQGLIRQCIIDRSIGRSVIRLREFGVSKALDIRKDHIVTVKITTFPGRLILFSLAMPPRILYTLSPSPLKIYIMAFNSHTLRILRFIATGATIPII